VPKGICHELGSRAFTICSGAVSGSFEYMSLDQRKVGKKEPPTSWKCRSSARRDLKTVLLPWMPRRHILQPNSLSFSPFSPCLAAKKIDVVGDLNNIEEFTGSETPFPCPWASIYDLADRMRDYWRALGGRNLIALGVTCWSGEDVARG